MSSPIIWRQLFRFVIQTLLLWVSVAIFLVDSGIGLLYRPTRLHKLAGRYDTHTPLPQSTISPSQRLRILSQVSGSRFWNFLPTKFVVVNNYKTSLKNVTSLQQWFCQKKMWYFDRQFLGLLAETYKNSVRRRKIKFVKSKVMQHSFPAVLLFIC